MPTAVGVLTGRPSDTTAAAVTGAASVRAAVTSRVRNGVLLVRRRDIAPVVTSHDRFTCRKCRGRASATGWESARKTSGEREAGTRQTVRPSSFLTTATT